MKSIKRIKPSRQGDTYFTENTSTLLFFQLCPIKCKFETPNITTPSTDRHVNDFRPFSSFSVDGNNLGSIDFIFINFINVPRSNVKQL